MVFLNLTVYTRNVKYIARDKIKCVGNFHVKPVYALQLVADLRHI